MSTQFPEHLKPPADEIMAEVWNARAQLLERHGGLHGLVAFLHNMDASEIFAKVRPAPVEPAQQPAAIAKDNA